jgi:hypothetical protein
MQEFLAIVATFVFRAQRYGDSSGPGWNIGSLPTVVSTRAADVRPWHHQGHGVRLRRSPLLFPAPIELGFPCSARRTDM